MLELFSTTNHVKKKTINNKFLIMPNRGDNFTVKLKNAHLGWGTHRHTNSRKRRNGEAYLKIPASVAYSLNITNRNLNGQSPNAR